MLEKLLTGSGFVSVAIAALRRVWKNLTRPAQGLSDGRSRASSQLLASLLLTAIMLGIIGSILPIYTNAQAELHKEASYWVAIGVMLTVFLAAYALSRTRFYVIGAILTIVNISAISLGLAVAFAGTDDSSRFLVYLVMSVVLAGMLFSLQATLVVALLSILSALSLLVLVPTIQPGEVFYPCLFLFITSLLLIVFTRHRDLTERERQKQLTESERQYRLLAEKATDLISRLAPDGTFLYVSPASRMVLGYEPEELVGRNSLELFHPDDLATIRRMYPGLNNLPDPFTFTYRVRRKDGTYIWVESTSRTFNDPKSGKPMEVHAVVRDVGQRKDAEKTLAQERDLLNTLMDTIPDAIYQKDLQGRFIRLNQAQAQNLGVPNHPEMAIGRTDFDFFDVEHSRQASDDEQIIVATGKPMIDRIEQYLGVDGTEVWMSSTKMPLYDPEGKVVGIVGISRDISTRKRTEDALRTSEEQLRSLIASMDDLIFSVDLNGRFLVYHAAAKVTHDTPVTPSAKFVGRRFQEMFPTDVAEKLDRAITVVKSTYSSQQLEYSLEEEDGEHFYNARISPIVGHRLQLLGVTVVARDVTVAVRARQRQERLFELEKLHRTVTALFLESDNPDEAINRTLAQVGQFLDVSRAYVFLRRDVDNVFDNIHEWCAEGVSSQKSSLQGIAFDEIVPSFLPMLVKDSIVAARQVSQLPEDQQSVLSPRGIQSVLNLPIHIDGRLQGFLGFDEVRGPRDWLPEDIATIRTIVEAYSRILERYRARMALIEARDAALRSAKLKSEFMSNMSHEIRTPMTGVLGMLELLLETGLDEEQREFSGAAYKSAQNLLEIVDDILDFSKIEAGKIVLESTAVNIRALVHEVRTTMLPQATKRGISLDIDIADDVPLRVFTDSTRLRQVLMNFVSNAVKFTAKGGVRVHVEQILTLQGRSRIRFEVTDTGIGIPPEQVERIFDSFVQGDGSTTRRFGGTGLGLAICKQIVQLMGGQIDVSSIPGEGSTFGFTLTFPIASDAAEGRPLEHLSDLRLLVVEEENTARYMLAQQLRVWGTNVVELGNPADLEMTLIKASNRGEPFHAVFMHGKLPIEEQARRVAALRSAFGAQTPQIVALIDTPGQYAGTSAFSAVLHWPVRQSELYDMLSYIQPANNVSDELSEMGESEPPPPGSARVLLAEDNYMNREIVLRTLRKAGLDVEVATDGQEALSLLRKNPFDLILMDIHMPNMDGLETTRRIRAMSGPLAKIPIIALTASILPEEQQRYLDVGMNGVLAKPFSVEKLREIALEWLKEPKH